MKKFLISFIIILVLGVGFYFTTGLFNNNPPEPIITVEGNSVETAQGSYCWRGLFNAKCVDMISPPDIIKQKELKPLVASPEAKLKIVFKKKPKENTLVVNRWISNVKSENVSLSDNVLLVPKEKGVYVYDVSARWKRGSSSYVFVIEVQ